MIRLLVTLFSLALFSQATHGFWFDYSFQNALRRDSLGQFTTPGLVEVRTSYKIASTCSKKRIIGTGFLEKKDGLFFIWTAAHLVNENDVSIRFGNNEFVIIDTLVDSVEDLALIRVEEPSFTTPFIEDFQVVNDFLQTQPYYPAGMRSETPSDDIDTSITPYGVNYFWDTVLFLRPWEKLKYPKSQMGCAQSTVHYLKGSVRRCQIKSSYTRNQLIARVQALPGMSGAPLVTTDGELLGVSIESTRHFDYSFFVPLHKMETLYRKYENGQRGHLDGAKWKYQMVLKESKPSGLFYRIFKDGTVEAIISHRKVGDGGTGNNGDGGTGNDGGSQELSCTPSKQYKQKGNLNFGLLWQGKFPTIAFKGERGSEHLTLYADVQSKRFVEDHPEYNWTSISPNSSLIDLLATKLGKQGSFNSILAGENIFNPKSRMSLGNAKFIQSNALLMKSNPNIAVIHTHFIIVKQEKSQSRIDFILIDGENGYLGEKVAFSLDGKGHLIGSNNTSFQSILKVNGSKGGSYYVDLRDFFFTNISTIQDSSSEVLEERQQTFGIQFRREGEPIVNQVEFHLLP